MISFSIITVNTLLFNNQSWFILVMMQYYCGIVLLISLVSTGINWFTVAFTFGITVLDKDNIGLLCCTNLMIGIISGIGLMFLCTKRHKAENYERFVKKKGSLNITNLLANVSSTFKSITALFWKKICVLQNKIGAVFKSLLTY